MKILCIIAGTNEPSNSAYLASTFLEGANSVPGCETVTAPRLKDLSIEHFSMKCYDSNHQNEPDFEHMRNLILESDGVVIATPVWNFGVPAHLKNLIDRMGSFALDETHSRGTLGGKPFYFIFTGGAPLPAWLGMMSKTTGFVPEAFRYFGGTPIGTHFEEKCTAGRGVFGLVVDQREESLKAVRQKGVEFARITEKFVKEGKLPVAQNYKGKLMKFGEKILKKLT